MSPKLLNLQTLRTVLRPILSEAREEDERENPTHARHPFFHPVTIALDEGLQLSAFSRDLSAQGIGLLHYTPIPLEEVEIRIATGRGYLVTVRTRLTWCRPCGDGFFVSGGNFTSVPAIGSQ